MRKITIITVTLFILFIATGFEKLIGAKTKIENVFYVTTVGIDKVEDNVKVTIMTKQTSGGVESQGSEEDVKYYTSVGETIFDANRKFHRYMAKDIFWGHLDIILISEEIAEENVAQYLDFFVRDHELSFTSKVFLIKEYTAEEIIKTVIKSKEDITDKINNMLNSAGAISISSEVSLLDAFNTLDNENSSAHFPVIRMEKEPVEDKSENESTEEENVKLDAKVMLDGYAFFDHGTTDLVGFLEENQARGFNFVKNKIKSGVILVNDPEGVKISLEIIDSSTKIIPEINGDNIHIKIKTKMSSNIAELMGSTDVFTEEYLNSIKRQQNEIVKNEIQDSIDFAKHHNQDIFDISTVILHKDPIKYEKMQYQWDEIFSKMTFEVEVESKINRVYVIKKPIKSGKDE